MSTKTTFKRVALVAVAALGLGVLSSVAPANARTSTATITLGTPVAANAAVVGQASLIAAPITLTSLANSDTFAVSATLISQPAGSTKTTDDITATGTAVANIGANANSDLTVSDNNTTISTSTYSHALSGTYVAGSTTQYFSFTPAVAGTYTFAVFLDGASGVAATGAIKSLDTVKYVSITAVATPAVSAEITQPLAGSIATYEATGSANGAVLRVRVKDAAGAYSRLDGSQQVLVNLPSGVSVYAKNGSSAVATTQYGLVAADFDATGNAYLNVSTGTAGSYAITAGLAGSTAVSTVSVVFVAPTGISAAASSAADNPSGVASAYTPKMGVTGGVYTSATAASVTKTQTSTTVTAFGAATAKVIVIKVADTTAGRIFGYTGAGLIQDLAATTATTAADADLTDGSAGRFPVSVTITHSALATSSTNGETATGFDVSAQLTSNATAPALTMTVTGVTAGANYWDTDLPTSTYLVVNGGSITVKADLYSQYGVAKSGTAVTAIVSAGRNVQTTATNLVTDADGRVSFTLTDAKSTSTTSSDTITFSDGTTTTDVTINYVAALAATTMTTTPSATTTTALSPSTLGAVNTATATASTGAVSVTALAKDAAGVVMVGLPVTLTLPAGVELKSTSTLVAYTDSTGTATWSVYTTKAGTYKFTFTGGGLTKDSYGKFTGGSARVVTVTAGTSSAGVTPVTVKVADAYGNGVGSVNVSLTATGGYFQGIPMSSTQQTNANGEVVVAFIGSGSATATAAETHMFYGAALVGTTAAVGFPAGVSTATATVDGGTSSADSAADAAAEATDAANAATDAANAAAEAADAATAAAQDAADAVAALSAQVSTMMASLKAQLTALTNLVIKIQKKVKA